MRQRRQRPGEGHGELVALLGFVALGQFQHLILEGEHGARVDLDRQVELDGTAARLLGVQVHLPRLAHGVGLDEVPLVVDVEAVVRGVVLEVRHEPGDVDDCHRPPDCQPGAAP